MIVDRQVAGRHVGVVGMARSGVAAALLVARHGGRPFVSDAVPGERLAEALAMLDASRVPYETGGHSERLLACELLVVSPGVRPDAPVLEQARRLGLPIIGELELASWFCPCPIVAVTGSNGKTTTTALIAALLTAGGLRAPACGNIGRPLADVVDDLDVSSVAVVEVSSFQLSTIAHFRPHVAAILNVSPDHLDWHGSMEAYRSAKHRIASNLGGGDWLVLNADDAQIRPDRITTRATRLTFSIQRTDTAAFVRGGSVFVDLGGGAELVFAAAQVRLLGRHNLANAVAAALCARLFGVAPRTIAGAVASFPGVEHRLEVVSRIGGVTYINDSKATNVDATCVALAAIDASVHLILGGRHKGAPYGSIARAAGGRLASVVAIGEAAEKIVADLGEDVPVTRAATLEDAVRLCHGAAAPGDVVLLSPACSSFDMFSDYEARGRAFRDVVAQLAAEAAAAEAECRSETRSGHAARRGL